MTDATKEYIKSLIQKKMREDGRGAFDYRKLEIEERPLTQANGSARVKLGETEIIVGVKLDAGTPYPDSPDEGAMMVSAELTPLASPEFESGPPSIEAIEVARVVDRAIRESKCIDFSKLCIKKGEKVWMVFIDIYPINYDGNLFDAAVIGANVALKNAVFPKYDEEEGKVSHRELTKEKLPLRDLPVLCTFGKLGSGFLADPSRRETNVLDARLSIATVGDRVCAMQKGGEGTFTEDEIFELIDEAFKKGAELKKFVK